MGNRMPNTVRFWNLLSRYNPNEGDALNPEEIWGKVCSTLPNEKVLKVFICDPHICTGVQLGSLLLLFRKIYEIWDKVSKLRVTLVTGGKSMEEMHQDDFCKKRQQYVSFHSIRKIVRKQEDIYNVYFLKVFPKGAELDVRKLTTYVLNPQPKREAFQHDRCIMFLIEEGGRKVLYNVSLSHGVELFRCLDDGNDPSMDQLLGNTKTLRMQRSEVTVFKFCLPQPVLYYSHWFNLIVINNAASLNQYYQRQLNA